MNCDDAFERLTSPDAPLDAELQRHLTDCRRCRAMRDTLSPALEWLSVSYLRPESADSRGGRRDVFLTDEAVQVAERAARRLVPAKAANHQRTRSRRSLVRWSAAAAVVVIGFLAVAAAPNLNRSATMARAKASTVAPAACRWSKLEIARDAAPLTSELVVSTCVSCHLTLP